MDMNTRTLSHATGTRSCARRPQSPIVVSMPPAKRKQPDEDTQVANEDKIRRQATRAYILDLMAAERIFHGDTEGSLYPGRVKDAPPVPLFEWLVVDESFDGAEASIEVGKKNNVRTLLALAEGIRARRNDALRSTATQ